MDDLIQTIRCLHFSDTHYCNENLLEAETCLNSVVEVAETSKPDVIVLSGDSTEHRLEVHSKPVLALSRRIKQLSAVAPMIILQGTFSHEPPGTIEMLGLMSNVHPIAVANRICQIALTLDNQWIFSVGAVFADGELYLPLIRLVVTCVPTINKANVAAQLGGAAADVETGQAIQNYLTGCGAMNQLFAAKGIPTMGISHGTVRGSVSEHGVPMNGPDHEFTTDSLFDAQCSAFLLGHIHKHQSWDRFGRKIAYPGSVGRFHHGEKDDKGFLFWSVSAQSASFSFMKTPARTMGEFDFNGPPDYEELMKEAPKFAGGYVRIRWQIDEEHSQLVSIDRIKKIFESAVSLKLEPRILKIQRSRAEGINKESGLANKLKVWCSQTNIPSEPLLERFAVLTQSTASDTANKIIADIAAFEQG
ncbi:metallophosphoesterase family protein [Undibacterium oligocarboniphilum]|uniref:Metallophosphatase family protein n=1 Tax=Undibacterium oligocarboniphilum TaxID=666702 RepID=A0A850QEU5_9BURK|nr:metallophosphatase family protein [Undibacterium oligocarboniphilum]MBC3871432.1 metallophosphatase family protein [Undibacterium oligocarboniphilum]NVO78992.1 metallophosphatase family protein [Undibacterium oligocarboniphilum]